MRPIPVAIETTPDIFVARCSQQRRRRPHAVTNRIERYARAKRFACAFDDRLHRLDQIVKAAQRSEARTELVSRKIETERGEAVTREKIAEQIEILLAARIPVTDNQTDATRALRFVCQISDAMRARLREAQIDSTSHAPPSDYRPMARHPRRSAPSSIPLHDA